ncbi:hypothetical protein INQ93_03295 [Chlamydia suis]|nr:hypothetical protein [Chlamydia suis]QYC71446.1 hypothetical protein INQ81_03295 [Chlamydia suis]QYC72341.1 hypothetical protein INQ82_03300 [Chlamydia suis]QYC73237.1 hypothetical protein INQ83_03305 [Chlamydia suis]QYC78674.1 hypothetical protein INQ89_03630 [Chlamydia suis]QYC79640.1 hypothetical protein INQ90_03650 [Chlamydia suis]
MFYLQNKNKQNWFAQEKEKEKQKEKNEKSSFAEDGNKTLGVAGFEPTYP